MDDGNVFLARLAEAQLENIRQSIPVLKGDRGRAFTAWLLAETKSAADRLDEIKSRERPAERTSRRLQRLRQSLNRLFEHVVEYQHDAGRSDLPNGLLYAIDEIALELLAAESQSDLLIHDTPLNMYSTNVLKVRGAGGISGIQGPADDTALSGPVVLNLPGLDRENAILLPILVHEVGHIACRNGLRKQLVTGQFPSKALKRLEVRTRGGMDPPAWSELQLRLGNWWTEYLCDCLAGALTGPGLLLAQAAFLGVSADGGQELPDYPATRSRVVRALATAKADGWGDWMQDVMPATLAWLEGLAYDKEELVRQEPTEKYLQQSSDLVYPAMRRLARRTVARPLTPAAYDLQRHALVEHITLSIPPAQIGGGPPPSVWAVLLAAWEVELGRKDAPETLSSVVHNKDLNAFLIKSIELASIARVWQADVQLYPDGVV